MHHARDIEDETLNELERDLHLEELGTLSAMAQFCARGVIGYHHRR